MDKRVFWFHYNKKNKCMTIHWHGQCLYVDELDCQVPCKSKFNTKQPKIVMRGLASAVDIKFINGGNTKIGTIS